MNLDTQITESFNSAIHDSILPSIQNSLSGHNSGLEQMWTQGPVD